jgi:ribonuclease G
MHREILFSEDAGESWAVLLEDGKPAEAAVERRGRGPAVGDVFLGIVRRVVPGMQAAFVDIGEERAVFLHAGDIPTGAAPPPALEQASTPVIGSLVHEGQRVILQLLKPAGGGKGARGSLKVSLPGRFVVYTPFEEHLAVSRRIDEPVERERLMEMARSFARPGEGFILRTAASGRPASDLEADADRLRGLWNGIVSASSRARASTRLHREQDLLERVIRDLREEGLEAITIEGSDAFIRCRDALARHAPSALSLLRRHQGREALLDHRGVRTEIEASLLPRMELPSGGNIVISQTEALVAVDVNSARFANGETLEQTALETNLEAAHEIVRQLRLRDLGGIIVIDFIDMEEDSSRQTLMEALAGELERDRSYSRVLGISDFGLVEMTRKRSRPSLDRTLLAPCPTCRGSGRIKSAATLDCEIRRELRRQSAARPDARFLVRVNPTVAGSLSGAGRLSGEDAAHSEAGWVRTESDPAIPLDRFELVPL